MKPACLALCVCASLACRDWERFSSGVGQDGGGDDGQAPSDADLTSCISSEESNCPGELAVCDGFENGDLGADWVVAAPGLAAVEVATTCARRGDHAVRVQTPRIGAGASARATIRYDGDIPTAEERTVRFFLFLDQELEEAVGEDVILAAWTSGDASQVQLRARDTGGIALYSTDLARTVTAPRSLDAERWICVELEVIDFSSARLWLDGADAPTLELDEPIPRLTAPYVGLFVPQAGAVVDPLQAHIDEVLIDVERPGCER